MSNKTRDLKQNVKAHAPAILAVTGTVALVTAYVFATRKVSTPELSNFFKNAADPTVEIILGNDDAFVVMTEAAVQHLHEFNTFTIQEGSAGTFMLMFTEPNV